ncbi:unnamed protein product [Closterium sp. NIES-54]
MPIHTRRAVRPIPPPVPGTHIMALRPSSVPKRLVLPSPLASSLPHILDLESDLVCTASPTVTRLLATVVTDPSFESAAASALVAELVDLTALCRLDYDASLVFYSSCPPTVGGELALGCDVLEDRQFELECIAATAPHLASTLLCPEGDSDALDIPTPRSYADAITSPYSSQWKIAMDAEMASWKSIATYVNTVPPHGANIVDGMWIFMVKRPPGSPPAFKARYIARGATTSCTPLTSRQPSCMAAFTRLSGTSLPPFYVFVYIVDLVFATADTEALSPSSSALRLLVVLATVHSSSWSLPQSTPLPTGHWLSAPPLDESVESGGPYQSLWVASCALGRCKEGTALLVQYIGHGACAWADDHTTHRSTQGYSFSLGTGSVSWISTRSSSVLSSSCEAEIYAGAMAAKEFRWLTYLLTELGERPRSPPILYVDNKAMIAFCQDQRMEHRTKHIALCNVLTRELQQRG